MDRKKIENRLIEWAREFGFTLRDGSFPKPDLFSQLVATPNRAYLWDIILDKLESKEKVQKIRKFILVTKLKSHKKRSKTQDYSLNIYNSGIEKKLNLWRKKEMLQKKISEKKREISELQSNIYKKAQSIQSEVCKLAEIEKYEAELQEKVLISNLLLEEHRNTVEKYMTEVEKIKSFGIFNFNEDNVFDREIKDKLKYIQTIVIEDLVKHSSDLEIGKKIYSEISLLISDKNIEKRILDLLLENKIDQLNKYSVDPIISEEYSEACDEEIQSELSVKSVKEQFMLDIIENSLQTCLNKTCENIELLKFNEVLTKIEKTVLNENIFNASSKDISYIKPSETGDSFNARSERMSKLIKAISFHGLKKRRQCLRHEMEMLAEENEKNEHWTAEMEKFKKETLLTSNKLATLKNELVQIVQMHKLTSESVLKKCNELGSITNDINYRFKEKNIFELLGNLCKEIRKGMETKIELVDNMFLDGFRRIQISPGKEVFEYESLHHCLNHYGGELRELFCSILLSPYDKPKTILAKLEARKAFSSHINEILETSQKGHEIINFCNDPVEDENKKLLEKNYKEVELVLSKILMQRDILTKERDLVKKILRSWLEQPYRYMIPDSIKVDSMTLRRYEKKYEGVVDETKYCSYTNETFQI